MPVRTFKRFVQIGRVALINYGPDEGKLCVIVDVIDANRVLVDGPHGITGVRRQSLTTKRISLTDLVISIPRSVREKTLKKAFIDADVQGKWAKTTLAKRQQIRIHRASLGDFDRFKVMLARKKRSGIVKQKLSHVRREAAEKIKAKVAKAKANAKAPAKAKATVDSKKV
eukprot:TRINITY_DN6885_c0_g1_i2.p1 TRINITY_DN6885_c0_g1~~TRINITY_DN6885_c0_g1_i2.p1  ORF type:complete len:170 (-),score=22.91 TRINITY_DN6885_c0_g1_i2:42-551(-)